MSYKKREKIAEEYEILPGDSLLSERVLNRSPRQLIENADVIDSGIENIADKAGIECFTEKTPSQPEYESKYFVSDGISIKRGIEFLDRVLFNIYQLIESQDFLTRQYQLSVGSTFIIDEGDYLGGSARYADITESFSGILVCAYQPQRINLDTFCRMSFSYGDEWTDAVEISFNNYSFITLCPSGVNLLLGVLTPHPAPRIDIYQSIDEGATWDFISPVWNAPDTNCRLRVTQGYDGKFFMFNASAGNCYILFSNDNGVTWSQQSLFAGDRCSGFHNIMDQVIIIYSVAGTLYWRQSNNDGINWGVAHAINVSTFIQEIDAIVLPNGWWLVVYGEDGFISYTFSRDNGNSWSTSQRLVTGQVGRPSLTMLSNGDILCVYHQTVDGGNIQIKGTFIRLEAV
jgi:hypothetical protein